MLLVPPEYMNMQGFPAAQITPDSHLRLSLFATWKLIWKQRSQFRIPVSAQWWREVHVDCLQFRARAFSSCNASLRR